MKTTDISDSEFEKPHAPVKKVFLALLRYASTEPIREIQIDPKKHSIIADATPLAPLPAEIFGFLHLPCLEIAGLYNWRWRKKIKKTAFRTIHNGIPTRWTLSSSDIKSKLLLKKADSQQETPPLNNAVGSNPRDYSL